MRATIQRMDEKIHNRISIAGFGGRAREKCRQHKNKLQENINASNTYFEIKIQENTFRKKINTFYGTTVRVIHLIKYSFKIKLIIYDIPKQIWKFHQKHRRNCVSINITRNFIPT